MAIIRKHLVGAIVSLLVEMCHCGGGFEVSRSPQDLVSLSLPVDQDAKLPATSPAPHVPPCPPPMVIMDQPLKSPHEFAWVMVSPKTSAYLMRSLRQMIRNLCHGTNTVILVTVTTESASW